MKRKQKFTDAVRLAHQIDAPFLPDPRSNQEEGSSSTKDAAALEDVLASVGRKSANKRNAAKSTGPKTAAGKRNVRLNALKHGLYSRELAVSDQDKPDFELLRESLRLQLAPRTALQDIGFEQIITSCWRCKLALRQEMNRLTVHFTTHNESTSNETAPQRDVRETQWYGSSPANLRIGMRVLREFRDDVSQNGPVHLENWKDEISRAFGLGFYDALTEWAPMDLEGIRMVEFLATHARNFNFPPIKLPEGEKIVADPKQKQQMVLKLIDMKFAATRGFESLQFGRLEHAPGSSE
jgi:hypothetical protein